MIVLGKLTLYSLTETFYYNKAKECPIKQKHGRKYATICIHGVWGGGGWSAQWDSPTMNRTQAQIAANEVTHHLSCFVLLYCSDIGFGWDTVLVQRTTLSFKGTLRSNIAVDFVFCSLLYYVFVHCL